MVQESIKWAQKEHGKENIVSAVLHMDEETPHLHISLVPVVSGESKKQRTTKREPPRIRRKRRRTERKPRRRNAVTRKRRQWRPCGCVPMMS